MSLPSYTIRFLMTMAFVTVILLPFTNCGQYAETAFSQIATFSAPCDDDCITPTRDNLQIRANVGGGANYEVPATLYEFNIGGECNEGGYPYNVIRWTLLLNGNAVRNSGMAGMGGNTLKCVNGRFLIYVSLLPINPEDNVDRTGLKNGQGGRSAYDLQIEIYGLDAPNDPMPKGNTIKGRTRLTLSAI